MRDVMIKRKIGISQITNDVFIEALDLQQKDISAYEKQHLYAYGRIMNALKGNQK